MAKPDHFYTTPAWKRASRRAVAAADYRCRGIINGKRCNADLHQGYNVHHHKPVRTHPHLALDPMNHIALCLRCHRDIESRKERRIGADINGYPTGRDHPWSRS